MSAKSLRIVKPFGQPVLPSKLVPAVAKLAVESAMERQPWYVNNMAKLSAARKDGKHDPIVLRNVRQRLCRIARHRAEEDYQAQRFGRAATTTARA